MQFWNNEEHNVLQRQLNRRRVSYYRSDKMFYYYLILTIGAFLLIVAIIGFISMYRNKDYTFYGVVKGFVACLLGALLLWVTLPSLKHVVLKEYDLVNGKCVIEIDSAGRSTVANFKMLETGEIFAFNDIPSLDAYGKAIPYYCEVTATKDHMFEISYKIYDSKTEKLILTSE